jgi:hypothetical protein
MSLVMLSEVRALVETGLTDVDLQAILDREEGWLASRIGALSGERTETFRPALPDAPIYLSRRTDAISVTDNAVAVPVGDLWFVPATGLIRRINVPWPGPWPGPWPWTDSWSGFGTWAGPVAVTYTPTDADAVARAVIELVQGTLAETGSDAETIGDYSYSRGGAATRLSRLALARSVLLRRPAYAMRLRSSVEPA